MAVVVPVLEPLLMHVRMGVNAVAVTVLVLMLDVFVIVPGVRVLVHRPVGVLVLVAVWLVVLVVVLGVVWGAHYSSGSRGGPSAVGT